MLRTMKQTRQQDLVAALKKHKSLESLRMFKKDQESSPTKPNIQLSILNQNKHQFNLRNPLKIQTNKPLNRIKSTDHGSRQTSSFKNIVQLHKQQYQNLKKQNQFLLDQIQDSQKNQEILYNYIQHLQKQITQRKYIKKLPTRQDKVFTSYQDFKTSLTHMGSYKSTDAVTEGTLLNQKQYDINQFNIVQRLSQEPNKKIRNTLKPKSKNY